MRIISRWLAVAFLLALAACGGGSSSSSSTTSGPLSGNWQLTLVQGEPRPQSPTPIAVSGFFSQSKDALSGSVQVPAIGNSTSDCGGIGSIAGTVSGQTVSFTMSPGGTVLTFTGSVSSDNTTMSGSYQGPGGACFTTVTTGTWTASLIPALNGNFTGTLSNSTYMALLTGVSMAPPIAVSGTITQSPNIGSTSNATLTGTITATGYPCFTTAALSGTISGQNVYLAVLGYNGEQIGTLGVPGIPGGQANPAIVATGSSGVSLTGTGQSGLQLGVNGVPPCPAIAGPNGTVTTDATNVDFNFE